MTIYKALSLPEQVALQREVEELRARVASMPPAVSAEPCEINSLSSRVCELGTKCCITKHSTPHPHAMSAEPVTDPESHPNFYTWTWDVLVSGNWRADYGWKRPVAPVRGLKPLFTAPKPVVSAEPVAWEYELAQVFDEDYGYDCWEKTISDFKPSVPDGGIRNIRALSYLAPQPSADAKDATECARSLLALAEWRDAPRKTAWGAGMMAADVKLTKDETMTVYVHSDALKGHIDAAMQKGGA